jgi:hypothetical protein
MSSISHGKEVGVVSIQDRPGLAPGAPADYPGRFRSRRAVLLGVAVVCSAAACAAAVVLSSGGSAGASSSEGGDASSSSDSSSDGTAFSTSAVSVGQSLTQIARVDDLASPAKCVRTVADGANGNFFIAGTTEIVSAPVGKACVWLMRAATRAWEVTPVPMDGFFFQVLTEMSVAPSGNFALVSGAQRYASTTDGEQGWASLVDAAGKLVWKQAFTNPGVATAVLATDANSYIASGSALFKVANVVGATRAQVATIPSDTWSVFAAPRAAPADPVFFAYNADTTKLTRLGQSAAVTTGSGVLHVGYHTASNPSMFYAYIAGSSSADLVGFSTSAATFQVDFKATATLKTAVLGLAVSPGNVYAAVCGFDKLSTGNDFNAAPLFVQRIHLATKVVAYIKIAQPTASWSMTCNVKGLSVNDAGEVVAGTGQSLNGNVKAVIYRFTGAADATTLARATSATANNIGLGSVGDVIGPIKVKATVPAEYTISGLDNTVVAFRDAAPPAPTSAPAPTAPATKSPTKKPTRGSWFGLRQ